MRYIYIDIARGLAILVVISWHVFDIHSEYTDGWTMPIFFIIMGLFYRQESSLKKMLKKKFYTLIIPYICFSVPAFVIGIANMPFGEFVRKLLNPYVCINGPSWFIICIFECYLLYYIINAVSQGNIKYKLILSLVISLCGFYMNSFHIMGHRLVLPFFISTAMTSIIFVALGDLCKRIILKDISNRKAVVYFLISGLIMIGGIYVWGCKPMDMIWNVYQQSYVIILLNALIGSFTIFYLSRILPHFLSIFGRYSLLLLIIHPYIIYLLSLFMDKGLLLYVLVSLLTLLISHIFMKYFPLISGNKLP